MTDEVAKLIDTGAAFNAAFATIAHKHDIWHHKDAAQYNYHFTQVMSLIREKISREKLSQSCKRKTPSIPPRQKHPQTDFKKRAAHDIE
jgi:hypothetical protein